MLKNENPLHSSPVQTRSHNIYQHRVHLSLCCSTFDVSDNYEKTEQIPNSLNSRDYSFGKPEAHPTLSSTLEIYLCFRVWQWQVTSTLGWLRHPTAMPAGCLLGEELQVCPIRKRRP